MPAARAGHRALVRIAQLAPLYERVPPLGYGGTERIVSYLCEALVDLGHDVSLFATADSKTAATLVPCAPRPLRTDPSRPDELTPHLLAIERAYARADEFDVIHSHLDHLAFALARRSTTPTLTTLHGRLDLPHLPPVFDEYAEQPVVSISHAQRRPLPRARWAGTVHHGIPEDLYTYHATPGRHLVFCGRISAEKRVDRAIAIAVRTGRPLRIAAKVDPSDEAYFESLRPLFRHPLVDFVGELDDAAKNDFLGDAAALLFPIDWPEPFGLTMIEAMACGTPTVAWSHGSVSEVMAHGETGFLCDDISDAVGAVESIGHIDRARCRAEFERRFTAARMAREYVTLYERVRGTWGERFA